MRLAWLTSFSLLALTPVAAVINRSAADAAFAQVGIGLFIGCTIMSTLARRFAPFAFGLLGILMLGLTFHA
jgi:hypothetical protein